MTVQPSVAAFRAAVMELRVQGPASGPLRSPTLHPAGSHPPSPRSPNCSWWYHLRREISQRRSPQRTGAQHSQACPALPGQRGRLCTARRRKPAQHPELVVLMLRPPPPAVRFRKEELQGPCPLAAWKPMPPWSSPVPPRAPRRKSQPRAAWMVRTMRGAACLNGAEKLGCGNPPQLLPPPTPGTSLRKKGVMT